MPSQLKVSAGQDSDKGRKDINQDFHGIFIPEQSQLSTKGIAVALADGISSSDVSQMASESAVTGFLADYYCTPETWTVKKSAHCVLTAINSWLFSQTLQSPYRYDRDRGYVCTFSAMIIKGTTAHIFHVGDARVYRLHGAALEQLTNDHRLWVSQDKSYLSRALGVGQHIEIDYLTLPVEKGDVFVLTTDGIHEHVGKDILAELIANHPENLNAAAQCMVQNAYERGSDDNLTVQIVRIDEVPEAIDAAHIKQQLSHLPLPPVLEARTIFDGFRIIRELHASARSHVYLAIDEVSQSTVVIKTPSMDLQHDADYLERFMMEEWIARRINSPHVVKPCLQNRKHRFLYIVMEYIEGQTLDQWMLDNPQPDLESVRGIVEQIAKGLRAFHRLEMLHQDLRPQNVIIDSTGTVKIIDFGATRVAGLMEDVSPGKSDPILGTAAYTAPEYFLGERGTMRSDLFSLGAITYHMLTGQLPYGTQVLNARTRTAQHKLKYRSVLRDDREIPVWIDGVLRKTLHPDPYKRYTELSEFTYDLRHPNKAFLKEARPPLLERNPVLFWQGLCAILMVIIGALLAR